MVVACGFESGYKGKGSGVARKRGGAKLKIISWGTHGGLHGQVQQLIDD